MYKVMIVDDEKSIRDGLEKIIHWEEYGFAVCGLARSGEEAYSIYQKTHPDLILTDIRMPGMSGLELIEKLRSDGEKDLEFIILSGYADFEYARRAIKFGVSNYLLKPVDEDEIHHLLSGIGNKVANLQKTVIFKTRSKLNNMTYNQESETDQEDMNWMKEESIHGLYMIQIDGYRPMLSPLFFRHSERQPMDTHSAQLITEIFQRFSAQLLGNYQGFVIREEKCTMDIVVGKSILANWHDDIRQFTHSVRSWFLASGVEVDILIGEHVASFPELRRSLFSLEQRRSSVFYGKEDGVYGLCEDKQPQKELFITTNITDDLQSIIVEKQIDKIQYFVNSMETGIRQAYISPSVVRVGFHNLLSRTMSYAIKTGPLADEIVSYHDLWVPYIDVLSLQQLMIFLNEIIRKTIDALTLTAEQGDEGIVERIMQFIQIHYMEKITIQMLSKRFFLNSAYLGQVFRKKSGISLNHYINSVRMNEAKKLLQQTNLKVYEVAHRIGFDDSNYFIIRFEEYSGQSPISYRQNGENKM